MRTVPRILAGLLTVLLACSCGTSEPTGTTEQSVGETMELAKPPSPGPSTPDGREMLRGVTIDDVDNLDAVVAAVDALPENPTVRIVFDPQYGPEYYAAAVTALEQRADIMGELLDSTAMTSLTVDQVRARAEAYHAAFGDRIAIWEIGNEINGAWVGNGPGEINAKVAAAHRVITDRGGTTAITLNHWSSSDCWAHDWEQTIPYARTLPADVRAETDLVLLSIYETACNPPQYPDATQLAETLTQLGEIFPDADLGIGEVGAQGVDEGMAEPDLAEKKAVAERWIGMNDELESLVGPRFVGGWFWWYFCRDAVARPQHDTLLPTLDRLLTDL